MSLIRHELDLGELGQPQRLPLVVELFHLGPRPKVADGGDGAVHAHRALDVPDVGEVAAAHAAVLLASGRRYAALWRRLFGWRRLRRFGLFLRRPVSSLGRGRAGDGPSPRLMLLLSARNQISL